MNAMKPIFKTFFLALALIANIHFAYAQTQGGIIPNGKNVFLDQNGKPLSSGKVYFYTGNTGSTVPKTTYSDLGLTIPNTNPVVLDAAGRAILWGTGNYRQQVFDKNNNLIWDVLTSAAGSGSSGGGGASTGDGDLVGTIKPWAGMTPPNQYIFTYGQEVARATYPALLTAITSLQNVFCTSASPILTGVGDTTNFWIGMTVEIGCTVTGNSTIVSKTSSSVTLADNSNVTTSAAATFFPWGDGNKSTTFNIPDFRGLLPMGNNIMGGTASTNVSDANFGSQTPEASGAQGGNQSKQLGLTNLPANITSFSNFGGLAVLPATNGSISDALVSTSAGSHVPITTTTWSTQSSITSTSNNTGTSGAAVAFSLIPPSKTINYIIKVTPDTNSATATGVTSLGGMTGDIACGPGLLCTGNIISSLGTAAGGSNTQVQFNTSGALTGSNCFIWVSPALTIGLNGTCGGQLKLAGATSGTLIQQVASIAGTPTVTWGTNTGTPAVSATTPLVINTTTGNATLTTVPINLGGTSQTTVLAARSSTGLNIDEATSTGDANYTILSTDRMVYHTALSAARTDTLPAANSVNAGQQFVINDIRGVAGATNTITLQHAGSDTINGITSVVAINAQYGAGIFWSDGVSRWTFFPQSTGGGGGSGTVTQVNCGVGMAGGSFTTTGTCDNYLDPNSITDCTVLASVSGNALTVTLKTRAGNTPSSSEPCWVSFRNSTITTGDYTVVPVTAATSFSTGTTSSTLGSINNVPFAIWVTLWNNAGTVAIGVSNQTTASSTFALNENNIASTTACSACTTAIGAGVYYTTSALTSKAFRVFAKLEWGTGLTTAGTWASGPTLAILKTMSVPLPGQSIQTSTGSTQTQAVTTNTTYTTTGVNATLSPTSATNPVVCNYWGSANPFTSSSSITLSIQRGGSVVGFSKQAVNFTGTNGGAFTIASDSARDLPGTTASTTWGVFMKSDNASHTVAFPLGTSGGADGGGQISCTEIAS